MPAANSSRAAPEARPATSWRRFNVEANHYYMGTASLVLHARSDMTVAPLVITESAPCVVRGSTMH